MISENRYTENYLLDRFYEKYAEKNNSMARISIPTPDISSKDRKTFVKNFNKLCDSIGRPSIEVSSFISKELMVETSISESGILIINKTYKKNKIEQVIKKYIINFVQCRMCFHCDTIQTKETRIIYIVCNRCNAKTAI